MIKKAIVLAAGFGTRLRPLTYVTPKPLLPVWGVPLLARIVDRLREMGVTDIIVNCHHLHEQIEAWCKDNGCKASYEPEILGTGGLLNPLREWIGKDDFYLVNGDIAVEWDEGAKFSPAETLPGDILGECLVTGEGPRTIEAEPSGHLITCWKSPDPGWEDTYTYCGFARLKAKVLDYVEPKGFSTIVQAYERAMMDGQFMRAVKMPGLMWTDAGTMKSYVELNTAGNDNGLADIPQLKAIHAKNVTFLGARGSDRSFFKVDGHAVILYDDAKRGENAKYAKAASWLKAKGIPVPSVLQDIPEQKMLVMEWAGIERKMSLEEYVKVVEALAQFNSLTSAADELKLEPPFDAKLWEWERELFHEFCLGHRYQRDMAEGVAKELKNVASLLEKEPKALVHRDFQSSNVLWRNQTLSIIDFQGMRLGPAVYDLASLLYDPYVKFTEGERRALAALYGKKSGRPEIVKILPFAAVQRLVQCLGAYGRLASVGQPQFAKYFEPALENLLLAADEAGLDAVGALAEDLIAVEKGYHKHHDECDCDHDHEHGECHCGHHHHEEA